MSITKGILDKLNGFSEADFHRWFVKGFNKYYSSDPKEQFRAFEPLHAYIGLTGDLTKELGDLYALIGDVNVKENFDSGLTSSFIKFSENEINAHIVRAIMFLTAYAKITKLIVPIVECAEKGFFSNSKVNAEFFVIAMDVVKQLSKNNSFDIKTGNPMRRLVLSQYFKSIYAPKAFISLCQSEPNNFPLHLKLLRENFFEIHQDSSDNVHITAKRFLLYVGLESIANYFNQMKLIRWGEHIPPSDDWLINALFIGDHAQLDLIKIDSIYYIRSKKDNMKYPIYNFSEECTEFLLMLLYDIEEKQYQENPLFEMI